LNASAYWSRQGFTLAEILVASLLLLIAIVTVFNVITVSTMNTSIDRCRINALNAARKKLEAVRSQQYDTIGPGSNQTSPPYLGYFEMDYDFPGYTDGVDIYLQDNVELEDGIIGSRYVLIKAVDDPIDGTGVADTDNNVMDYKEVTVRVKWMSHGQDRKIEFSSFMEGLSELSIGGGDENKMVKKKKEKAGKGGMGMGGKSKKDPKDSKDEPTA